MSTRKQSSKKATAAKLGGPKAVPSFEQAFREALHKRLHKAVLAHLIEEARAAEGGAA